MGTSEPAFHAAIQAWVEQHFPPPAEILDVGCGEGAIARLLAPRQIDGVDVWQPDIAAFGRLYRRAWVADALTVDFRGYQLAIFGDVLEHFTVGEARLMLRQLAAAGCAWICQVPYLYRQGPIGGNAHEEHLQPDLTHEVFMARYADLGAVCLVHNDRFGVYYRFADDPHDAKEASIMAPHQERVIQEKKDLDEKATKLSNFIGTSPEFDAIDPEEQERLKQQCEVMWEYSEILGQRIAAFSPA